MRAILAVILPTLCGFLAGEAVAGGHWLEAIAVLAAGLFLFWVVMTEDEQNV